VCVCVVGVCVCGGCVCVLHGLHSNGKVYGRSEVNLGDLTKA